VLSLRFIAPSASTLRRPSGRRIGEGVVASVPDRLSSRRDRAAALPLTGLPLCWPASWYETASLKEGGGPLRINDYAAVCCARTWHTSGGAVRHDATKGIHQALRPPVGAAAPWCHCDAYSSRPCPPGWAEFHLSGGPSCGALLLPPHLLVLVEATILQQDNRLA